LFRRHVRESQPCESRGIVDGRLHRSSCSRIPAPPCRRPGRRLRRERGKACATCRKPLRAQRLQLRGDGG
jgi:hypothetical protein